MSFGHEYPWKLFLYRTELWLFLLKVVGHGLQSFSQSSARTCAWLFTFPSSSLNESFGSACLPLAVSLARSLALSLAMCALLYASIFVVAGLWRRYASSAICPSCRTRLVWCGRAATVGTIWCANRWVTHTSPEVSRLLFPLCPDSWKSQRSASVLADVATRPHR